MNPFERTHNLARAAAVALAVVLSAPATADAQTVYEGPTTGSHRLTILGTWESFFGYALNDIGDVLGMTRAPDGLNHVVRWDGTRLVDLGPGLPGDIDNRRQVVGGHLQDGTLRAATWDRLGRLTLLENESLYGYASAIGRSGHIAGYVITPSPIATLWYDGAATSLWRGYAYDVNRSGIAAGVLFSDDPVGNFAVISDGVRTTVLGSNAGSSFASAINERGDVVGEDQRRAVLWTRGTAIELALPAGDCAVSSAAHLDDGSTIVGYCASTAGYSRAVQWRGVAREAVDLNTLLSPEDVGAGWVLVQSVRVNRRGSVLGYATNALVCATCTYTFLLERID